MYKIVTHFLAIENQKRNFFMGNTGNEDKNILTSKENFLEALVADLSLIEKVASFNLFNRPNFKILSSYLIIFHSISRDDFIVSQKGQNTLFLFAGKS